VYDASLLQRRDGSSFGGICFSIRAQAPSDHAEATA
jgi:hypothetical protein